MRYTSSQQAARAPQQQSYHAPASLAASAGDALTALCATLDSESESCSSSGNDESESEYRESIRLRVHNRIMQRVQELYDAYNGHEDRCQSHADHQADQQQQARPSDNSGKPSPPVLEPGLDDLEILRQDVISVAAQILERHLHHEEHHQQKRELEPESAPLSSSFELRLVHRMLAKESELLTLQARRSHSGHRTRTANTRESGSASTYECK